MRDDYELLDAWRDGDRRAGNELFKRHIDAITRFFYGRARHSVEDLVQATFAAMVEGERRFRSEGTFRAFLFATARNTLYAHYRKQNKRGDGDHREVEAPAGEPTPSSLIVEAEEQKLLLVALRRLPLDLQIALEMTFWEELKMHELAEVLQIPAGTVASRIRRAKEKLADGVRSLRASSELIESTVTQLDDWARALRSKVERESDEGAHD